MRRLIRTFLLTALALALLWLYLPSVLAGSVPIVETVRPKQDTVYESVACNGTIRAQESYRLSLGSPAEILDVYVTEGELITAGQPILRYRLLNEDEIITSLYTSEFSSRVAELEDFLQGEALLTAAEYYAVSGELPPYFRDFYVPNMATGEESTPQEGILTAPINGTVTALYCKRGDRASGLFAAAVIEDTENLVASLQAPERVLSKLAIGLPVNISGAAFGDQVFAGRVLSVGTQAITTGGLLSKSETYVEVTASVGTDRSVISGLTVQGTIFFVMYEDAVLVPYEAVTVDADGNEFVYRCANGRLLQTPIRILYESDSGIVCDGSISADDVLVKHPDDTLSHGMLVNTIADTEVKS